MAGYIIKTINGVKQRVPVTSDTGSGTPLGSLITVYGNHTPDGYLPMETTFDPTQYPALYALLGTNTTPDTPCDLGADWDNATAITLSTSDWIAPEDGWVVGHCNAPAGQGMDMSVNNIVIAHAISSSSWYSAGNLQLRVNKGDIVKSTLNPANQNLSFVPFKKYAHVVIKATAGITENQADYVGDIIKDYVNDGETYSTTEVKTNKTWIDGKPIYRITLTLQSSVSENNWSWCGLQTVVSALNIDTPINSFGVDSSADKTCRYMRFSKVDGFLPLGSFNSGALVTIEYTKTTD